ncbi:MAG TPA: M48 family metallopeptidase, partial [Gammaproteobacteria bacterium]|nr:M48 family metallopeptidase [Gammaproteobacteria bacterium]
QQHRILIQAPVDDPDTQGDQLRHWLAHRARRVLKPWLAQVANECGLDYQKMQVRGQRTRWGSCSAQGSISLNYKLLFCDPPVVRYLLVHELCHTRHLNHGKRFWNLVARFEPDWRALDKQLGASWKRVPAWVEMR